MGLPCRFISASAGTVTFVMGMPVDAVVDPTGKLVTLMVVSSAAPSTQDATRTAQVYARSWDRLQRPRIFALPEYRRCAIESSLLPIKRQVESENDRNAQVRHRERNSQCRPVD